MTQQSSVRDDELLGAVNIPLRGRSMPGYLSLVDPGGPPRPTVIYTNGFGGERCENGYSVIGGAAALRRGYNFLTYDGPGQGAMLRDHRATMRPDWENVLGPVVDHASTVPPEIDDGASCNSATVWAVTWWPGTRPTTTGRPRSSATTA